jgi:hypothetical protein
MSGERRGHFQVSVLMFRRHEVSERDASFHRGRRRVLAEPARGRRDRTFRRPSVRGSSGPAAGPAGWMEPPQWRTVDVGIGAGDRLLCEQSTDLSGLLEGDKSQGAAWPASAKRRESGRARFWGLPPGLHALRSRSDCRMLTRFTLAVGPGAGRPPRTCLRVEARGYYMRQLRRRNGLRQRRLPFRPPGSGFHGATTAAMVFTF